MPIVVVNQNPRPEFRDVRPHNPKETEWFKSQSVAAYLENHGGATFDWELTAHGRGIDIAADWARDHGYSILTHLDADSLIRGRIWHERMSEHVQRGAWAISGERRWHGYPGLSPSMWRIDILRGSFLHVRRGEEMANPETERAIGWSAYVQKVGDANNGWFKKFWDTGQKNWFEAAVAGKAVCVDEVSDFIHFGAGGRRPMKAEERKVVEEYLSTDDFDSHTA